MDNCPKCTSADLVLIALSLNGGPVHFAHCRNCEHRWWTDRDAGAVITLPDVLTKATR
jgi:transcription elongation factor Elf1